MPSEDALPDPAALLEQVLNPLLDDFAASFERGLLLLDHCPERVLSLAAQLSLEGRLLEARAELRAAGLRTALLRAKRRRHVRSVLGQVHGRRAPQRDRVRTG